MSDFNQPIGNVETQQSYCDVIGWRIANFGAFCQYTTSQAQDPLLEACMQIKTNQFGLLVISQQLAYAKLRRL
jgi:hypothetical protein